MRFEGRVTIAAPRSRVWAFLTDPESVASCAPGLRSLEVLAPGERFRAVVAAGFGSATAIFTTDVEWLDLEPPGRARMKAHGTASGSAVDANSEMRLSEAEGGTLLEWTADVTVHGTIASLAARLMSSVAQRQTDAFFAQVRGRIEAGAAPAEDAPAFGPLPLEQAAGAVLAHNVSDAEGRPRFRKGRVLSDDDVAVLRGLGRSRVYAARPRPGDVGEDEAATRVARAIAGPALRLTAAAAGRVNLVASARGVLRVDAARLLRLNAIAGITVATLTDRAPVPAEQTVATVKIIPFAIAGAALDEADAVAGAGEEGAEGPVLGLDLLPERRVALLLSGSPAARERVERRFAEPVRSRVEALGSRLTSVEFVPLDEEEGEEPLAAALGRLRESGIQLVVLAGETAIADAEDVAPRAIRRAGGEVVGFGAPVDPGNLLLVAYLGDIPVLGAPGCVRSACPNVVDQVLPRLLSGERLDRAAIAALGHGGLLEDVPERPMPRSQLV